ncbi:type II toxin-antitoxin system death-on-curing family toxin [Acidobacteria bacterium AB60]|nr:type II toxin-antitoxin system death-on-curing family toxin [Acidobacteria bacterium AB60]
MTEPTWIREIDALQLHAQQINLFGGSLGVRDAGLLASALARPQNTWAYSESQPNLSRLAAGYAFGISSNHPFIDGNKRTALMVSFVFLDKNGLEMTATQEDAFETMLRLAAGEISEEQLAAWFERNTAPRNQAG